MKLAKAKSLQDLFFHMYYEAQKRLVVFIDATNNIFLMYNIIK